MDLPEPVFVGFFPKIACPPPEPLALLGVREICSVSNCIAAGPRDWVAQWKHNRLGFYDSEELALQVAGAEGAGAHLYAYRCFPFSCLLDNQEQADIPGAPVPFPAGYTFLGYDVVTRSVSDFFECSPLSCNDAAQSYPVNPFCLLSDLDQAYETLRAISRDGHYEPGPYYLFAVYRKPRPHDKPHIQGNPPHGRSE